MKPKRLYIITVQPIKNGNPVKGAKSVSIWNTQKASTYSIPEIISEIEKTFNRVKQ